MPRIEAYRSRFSDEIFTSRLEFKNHLIIQRDLERRRRADRKTNVDPAHLKGLWQTMRDTCTTFDEIVAFMLAHGKELGYYCALHTKEFQARLASGKKILDWPTITFVSFGLTEFHHDLKVGWEGVYRGWKPIMSIYVDHCFPKLNEDILQGTGFILDRKVDGMEAMTVVMTSEAWPGLCGTAAIEILSGLMEA
jgi:hypothetical protein